MKIATIVGARPQFIKAATVSRLVAGESAASIDEIIIHTGQHYDANLSDVFFKEMSIPMPNYHLHIGSGPHGRQTGKMLEAIEGVLIDELPDMALVYGDTNSTLAGALAAAKLHIPVAHVEAGLRSFNRKMPEEINRIVSDHLSELLFAPTATAVDNLLAEGVAPGSIHNVGDVMYDAALFYSNIDQPGLSAAAKLGAGPGEYILATIHRAENTDDHVRLSIIVEALKQLSTEYNIIMPLHPRTRMRLRECAIELDMERLHIIDPVGFLDMIRLEKDARLVITDSGGVQKEAYFYQVPCVILRGETEWVELLEDAWSILAYPETAAIIVDKAVMQWNSWRNPRRRPPVFGDGNAAQLILNILAGSRKM